MSRNKNPLTPGTKTENLCLDTTFCTITQYFPSLTKYFSEVDDYRQKGKIVYSPQLILYLSLLERLMGVESNNQFETLLRNSSEIENNMATLLNEEVSELPSIDSMTYFLQLFNPEEVKKIQRKMFVDLERKKIISKLKTTDGCLLLAIDGVKVFSTEREIEHSTYCVYENGTKKFFQYFLEAKIVSADGLVISLGTECIENPTTKFDKQDCERKAAVRLLERISKEHPHLKFYILGDALYCNSNLMDLCKKENWGYGFTFKGDTQYTKMLEEIKLEFNNNQQDNTVSYLLEKTDNTEKLLELSWCNFEYDLGGKGERDLHYLEGKIYEITNGVKKLINTFSYLIDEEITLSNAYRKFKECRLRWKIENEGFNFQKNNILHIGHSFSAVGNAGQNYYLLAQIAHLISQLSYVANIAGNVRRATDEVDDDLSQTLKEIFHSFIAVAEQIKTGLLKAIFKPPILPPLRIRLKFA